MHLPLNSRQLNVIHVGHMRILFSIMQATEMSNLFLTLLDYWDIISNIIQIVNTIKSFVSKSNSTRNIEY